MNHLFKWDKNQFLGIVFEILFALVGTTINQQKDKGRKRAQLITMKTISHASVEHFWG